MNAWLLTWEGTAGPAVTPDKKIVAIFSARRSARTVADIVDALYCRSVDAAYDMALLANKRTRREREYLLPGSTSHRFFYGGNPCIFARLVVDLEIERAEGWGTEVVRWTEPATFMNAESGSGIVEAQPRRKCELTRSSTPLSSDVYERAQIK
jgi:hypothetical protein